MFLIYSIDNVLRVSVKPVEFPASDYEFALLIVPAGIPYLIIDETSLPDYRYRNAWEMSGKRVMVNMDKARNLHRDKLRELRAPFLTKLDIQFMQAIEIGDSVKIRTIATQKQALRDVTKDPAIDAAATPDELAGVLPAALRAV